MAEFLEVTTSLHLILLTQKETATQWIWIISTKPGPAPDPSDPWAT